LSGDVISLPEGRNGMSRYTGPLPALRALTAGVVVALLCGSLPAVEEPVKNKEEDARQAEQSRKIQRSAAQHTIAPAGADKKPHKFHESAVMRWSNPVGGAKDGAVYIWTDGHRPQAMLKLFSFDGDNFTHEWQSLAEGPIVAKRGDKVVWKPTAPGVVFQVLPDAPQPADTAAARLRQMKTLAGKFRVTSTRFAKDATPTELRLLVQPLFRFEPSTDPPRPDGALFGFTEGTDPMALLMLEVRGTKESARYYYAFVRMTTFSVTGEYGGKEIYSADKYNFRQDPEETFLALPRQPAPKE
jgi:hypothetical protein